MGCVPLEAEAAESQRSVRNWSKVIQLATGRPGMWTPGADGTMARVVSMTIGGHGRSLSECRQLTVGDMEELGLDSALKDNPPEGPFRADRILPRMMLLGLSSPHEPFEGGR